MITLFLYDNDTTSQKDKEYDAVDQIQVQENRKKMIHLHSQLTQRNIDIG